MRLLIVLVAALAAQAQESAFSRIRITPRGAGVGSIDYYEARANGGNYTRLQGPDDQASNRTLTLPSAVSTVLVGQENYSYSPSVGFTIVGYRARGTESSPSNVVGNEVTLGLYGYARSGGVFSPASGIVQSVESVSPLVGRFSLYTDNGSGFGERLALSGAGHLLPGAQTQTIGASNNHWGAAYISSIQLDSPSSSAVMSIVPPNFASSFTVTLPSSNAAGYLYNDGSGTTSWSSSSLTPPVTWDLDNTSDVLTLGSHNSTAAQQLVTRFSRGTTDSPTTVSNGDQFLQMTFQYYAESGYKDSAAIWAYVDDSTPGNDTYGSYISILTSDACTVGCPGGGNPAEEKLRIGSVITANASLEPGTTNAYNLGNSTKVWGAVYMRSLISDSSADISILAGGGASAIWKFTALGNFTPLLDNTGNIGTSTIMPTSVWAKGFGSYTDSAYGIQNHSFTANQNSVNVNLFAYGGSGSTNRGGFHMYRAGGSYPILTAVANGDRLGVLAYHGYSNSQYNAAAIIEAYVSGTVSGTTVPTEMRHRTMNTSGTLADRWILKSGGHWVPGANLSYDLGESGTKIRDIYMGGTITNDGDYAGLATVTQNWTPSTGSTYDLGSSTTPWNDGYANNWQADTALYVVTSGTTRFSASGGGINVYNSSGTLKFSVSGSTGAVDSASGYKYNGTAGLTQSISVRKGDDSASCTLTVDGGIITGTTC